MKLDYGTQLSPTPIKLSIGTLRKPKLIDISEIGFDEFGTFEMFSKMTPERYCTNVMEDGKTYWNSLSEDQQDNLTMYDLIMDDSFLQEIYLSVFKFFFVEPVVFKEDIFIILRHEIDDLSSLTLDDVCGAINRELFPQILELIQQICCIYEKQQKQEEMKFKNKAAKKLYEKMLKAQNSTKKKADNNMSLPNIISSVASRHPSINLMNIWDLTIFQLLDSFNRLQSNAMYEINCTRVSVWGDEKKTFDATLWYKNNHDTE